MREILVLEFFLFNDLSSFTYYFAALGSRFWIARLLIFHPGHLFHMRLWRGLRITATLFIVTPKQY